MLITIRKPDPELSEQTLKIISQRAAHSQNSICAFCGVLAKKHGDIVFIDGDERNQDDQNIKWCCYFCHAAFYGGMVNGVIKGSLIVLPNISQPVLNQFFHGYFALKNARKLDDDALLGCANTLFNQLKLLENQTEKFFGVGAHNPVVIIDLLSKMHKKIYINRHQFIGGLRFLPSLPAFEVEINWSNKQLYNANLNKMHIEAFFNAIFNGAEINANTL